MQSPRGEFDPLMRVGSAELSEARAKALIRASAEMIWIVSPRGDRLLDVSAWRAFTGQTRQETENGGWFRAVHPLDRARTIRGWLKAVRHGLVFRIDHRLRRYDGVYRVLRACAAPITDDRGNVLEWIGMHSDITEQTLANNVIEQSELQFRKLFNSDLVGIAFAEVSGSFIDGNDEFLRIVGYSHDDLRAGKVRWDDMTPLEYKAIDEFRVAEAIERGSCRPYEKEYIRKDGTRASVLVGFTLLDTFPLSEARFVGFILDISTQKKLESSLKEREASFRGLADSLPQLVWTADAAGRKEFCNERYHRYTGLPTLEEIDRRWLELIHPDDRPVALQAWKHAIQSGEPYQCEYRFRRADGAYRYFLARAVPSRDDTGSIIRWLGSSTDIHDQKLIEQSMRRSEKLAVAGRLASSIAHEINNPLMGVSNALFLALQDQSLDAPTRSYLKLADQELKRVSQITTRTLQFHRQSEQPSMADVCQLMDSILNVFRPRLKDRQITVTRRYSECGNLYCYAEDLRQAFASILSNGADALSDGGELKIRICRARRHDTQELGFRITIADNGMGLAPDLSRRVFEPFFSTKEATGTGLGLWVTLGIVQRHQGTIRFRGSIHPRHHGATVSIFLPIGGVHDQY